MNHLRGSLRKLYLSKPLISAIVTSSNFGISFSGLAKLLKNIEISWNAEKTPVETLPVACSLETHNPVIDEHGNKRWFKEGKFHRLDGPAIEWADGTKFWYIENKKLTEQEFLAKTKDKTMTLGELKNNMTPEEIKDNLLKTEGVLDVVIKDNYYNILLDKRERERAINVSALSRVFYFEDFKNKWIGKIVDIEGSNKRISSIDWNANIKLPVICTTWLPKEKSEEKESQMNSNEQIKHFINKWSNVFDKVWYKEPNNWINLFANKNWIGPGQTDLFKDLPENIKQIYWYKHGDTIPDRYVRPSLTKLKSPPGLKTYYGKPKDNLPSCNERTCKKDWNDNFFPWFDSNEEIKAQLLKHPDILNAIVTDNNLSVLTKNSYPDYAFYGECMNKKIIKFEDLRNKWVGKVVRDGIVNYKINNICTGKHANIVADVCHTNKTPSFFGSTIRLLNKGKGATLQNIIDDCKPFTFGLSFNILPQQPIKSNKLKSLVATLAIILGVAIEFVPIPQKTIIHEGIVKEVIPNENKQKLVFQDGSSFVVDEISGIIPKGIKTQLVQGITGNYYFEAIHEKK